MSTSNNEPNRSAPVDNHKCDGDDRDLGTRKCQVCMASWLNGQLFWSTGKPGTNLDLASLCCNRLATLHPDRFAQCANPLKGHEGGDTWEARARFIDAFQDEL